MNMNAPANTARAMPLLSRDLRLGERDCCFWSWLSSPKADDIVNYNYGKNKQTIHYKQ